jgi:hypothetical protein
MTFLVWHVIAIVSVMAISFIGGYSYAKRKEKVIELARIKR